MATGRPDRRLVVQGCGWTGCRRAAPVSVGGSLYLHVMSSLTADELALLDFEDQWWRYGGAKERDIAERFGLQPTRYYQRLNALIGRPEALAARPLVVRRLQRLRGARRRQAG